MGRSSVSEIVVYIDIDIDVAVSIDIVIDLDLDIAIVKNRKKYSSGNSKKRRELKAT